MGIEKKRKDVDANVPFRAQSSRQTANLWVTMPTFKLISLE